MAIRKQTIWEPKNDRYVGFVDYGQGGPILDDPDTLASEAYVFLLVGVDAIENARLATSSLTKSHQQLRHN